jgi:nitrogen fixation/metabolism regulation signal transduction histidine kinase
VLVRSTADFLLPILIQTVLAMMVILGLATIIVTLLFSHKIAGPLYRFKKAIEGVRLGNLSANFHLRNYDQLKGLSGEVNAMIDRTREQVNLIKADVANLKAKKGNISEQDVEELDKKINYFKT